MSEIKEQQSFQLGVGAQKREVVPPTKKVERDSRDRILAIRSTLYSSPNDAEILGMVTGKRGYWVRPIGKKVENLIGIRALEDISLHDPREQPVIVEADAIIYTYPNRVTTPKRIKSSPRGSR